MHPSGPADRPSRTWGADGDTWSPVNALRERLAAVVARHDQGDHAAARPEAEALLADVQAAGHRPGDDLRVRCVEVVALLRRSTGALAEASALLDDEIAREGGRSPRLLLAHAQIEHASGRWEPAVALALRAEAAARDGGAPGRGAECAALAARWMLQLGDLAGAHRCLDRAELALAELDPVRRASILLAKAELASAEGRPEVARACHHRRLEIAREAGLPVLEASALRHLGDAAWRRGERDLATSLLREQVGILRCLDDRHALARAAIHLGELHRGAGDRAAAAESYREARELAPDDPEVALVAGIVNALLDLEAGGFEAAARALAALEALAAGRPSLRVLTALGSIPAHATVGRWREVDQAIAVAEATLADLSAEDTELGMLVPLAAEAVIAAAATDGDRARAARLLALLHDWAARFGRPEAAIALARLRALALAGARIPIGPFTLVAPLGRGSSSTVWLARHAGRRLEVALKVLSAGARADLVRNELAAVARLDHPNVVWLLHHGEIGPPAGALLPELTPGLPWIAVEHVPGGTLADVAGKLPWPACRVVLLALLDALAHAHARGVLHLDLKPANVLLAGPPEAPLPKLADFGLARLTGDDDAPVAGSPAYMAPEQFLPGAELVPATDLYALGCLATTLVQGAPPFVADTIDALRRAHLGWPPPPLAPRVPVPDGLDGWVRRLLAKSTRARFRSAAEAARALRGLPEPPVGAAVSTAPIVAVPDFSATTLVLDADPITVPLPDASDAPGFPGTFPPDWRGGRPVRRADDLIEAGLGLFALRTPRLVGREEERDRLWALLGEAAAAQAPRAAVLRGPEGSGRRALALWLLERARELGAPDGLVRIGPPPDPPPPCAALWVRIRGDDPTALAIDLPPLEDDRLVEIVDARLPLVPTVRDALVRWAAGNPGRALARLRSWVVEARLARRAEGWDLRPGTPIP